MLAVLRDWYRRNFSDPEAVILVILLITGFAVVLLVGDLIAPFLVALVIAYVLEGLVQPLENLRVRRLLAVLVVLTGFLLIGAMLLFGLVPLLSQQVSQLVRDIPDMVSRGQDLLLQLPERYPTLFTEEQVRTFIASLQSEVGEFGRAVVSLSLAQAVSVFAFLVYVILVPLMVFFLLKDKERMLSWFVSFLPERRELSFQVWREVNAKIGNYIRGKVIEIAIVWAVSYVVFTLFGLNFSLLLSALVGVSVIIPYVGAIAVTIPVAMIGYFQWGFAAQFWWLLVAYQIIQLLDGNVLVPLLFSEVVNLHPVAIIVAVLFFGGLWGVWGIFFAIPLATLVQAVLNTWPHVVAPPEQLDTDEEESNTDDEGGNAKAPVEA